MKELIQNFDKLSNERAIKFENYLSITHGSWNTIHVFKEESLTSRE